MEICKSCFRRHWKAKIDWKTGEQVKHKNGNLVYLCIYCGTAQEEDNHYITTPTIKANQLYIDLELSKSLFANYGAKVPSKFIHSGNLIKERHIICWSASYIGNDKVWGERVTSKEAMRFWDLRDSKNNSDERIVKKLHRLMSSAEIIAGHNVKAFDIKHCFARFEYYGLDPIVNKQSIDTLSIARSKFKFEYNGLDYIAQRLGFRPKDDITDDDWNKILRGDKKSLDKCLKYNRGDVIEGKRVYERLVRWVGKRDTFGAKRSDKGVVPLQELRDEIQELREKLESA